MLVTVTALNWHYGISWFPKLPHSTNNLILENSFIREFTTDLVMVGDTTIHWFTYEGSRGPTPFVLVERAWGKAAIPLPYEIENGEYRISDRENELLTNKPTDDVTDQAYDLGEVMWWVDDGRHLIPMDYTAKPVTN